MEKLIKQLNRYCKKLPGKSAAALTDDALEKLYNVYPFNKFEYIISHLIAGGVLNMQEYSDLRADYIDRNRYLYLFELAPRTFGQQWGERHLMELVPECLIPRHSLDPHFAGEYDLWLDGVKIEVKASRAVRKAAGKSLAEKALTFGNGNKFDMNFQQLKPGCCDVFLWIAVWRDRIDYWLLPANDVKHHPLFSNQHRASQLDDDGVAVEGQIHINNQNYPEFEKFRVHPSELREKIMALGRSN